LASWACPPQLLEDRIIEIDSVILHRKVCHFVEVDRPVRLGRTKLSGEHKRILAGACRQAVVAGPTPYDILVLVADDDLIGSIANRRSARGVAGSLPVLWPAIDRPHLPHQVFPMSGSGVRAWRRTTSDPPPEWAPQATNAPSPLAATEYLCNSERIFAPNR
jgi:hypothetical protein